jgi:NADPH:quinone reductase-like Zn-dependent oxidoreductase
VVLIIGASGGVGTYAVQVVKALGAQVTGVCSTRRSTWSEPSAPTASSTTRTTTSRRGEQRSDAILDIGGKLVVVAPASRANSEGRLASPEARPTDAGSGAPIASSGHSCCPGSWARAGTFVSWETHEDMIVLKELIEAGKVTPLIDRTYPLSDVPEAIRY